LPRPLRKLIAAVIAALFCIIPLAPAGASEIPPDATWEPAWVTSPDGTRLQTDVFRPRDLPAGARTPVIVITGPYFGVGTDETDVGRPKILSYYSDLFDVAFKRGYSIVQVSLRGYGASEGCPDFAGTGEQADARAAVEWAASRPWSTGRVGTFGLSYDALTQVMNLGSPPQGLSAAVIIEPAIEQYRAIYMDGVRYARGALIPPYYATLDLIGPTFAQPAPPGGFVPGLSAGNPICLAAAQATTAGVSDRNPDTAFWRERSFIAPARGSRVPVLWAHGFADEQVRPDQFLPVWRGLAGPKRAWFAQIPHLNPGEAEQRSPGSVGRPGFTVESMRWYDRFLLGRSKATRGEPRVVVQEGARGRWRSERRWPPPGTRRHTLPVLGGSYLDSAGNKGEPGCFRIELNCPPAPSGVGSWTFSKPLARRVHLAGVPRLRVNIQASAPAVNLVALLYDIDAGNQASLISRGASRVTSAGIHSVELYPQDWRLRRGHRLGLLLSGADDGWFEPGASGTAVTVEGGKLRVPYLRCKSGRPLEGGPSQVITERVEFPVVAAIEERTSSARREPPRLHREC